MPWNYSVPPRYSHMRYVAYAVDTFGVSLATYEFLCASDADAEHRARKLLEAHPTIEIWQGTRRVVRLTRDGH